MAMPTAGRRDGGNSRHGPVRDGSLPDTRTVVTGMCIRKATGDSSCNCCRLCIEAALLAAVAPFGQVPAGWPRSDLPTNNGLNGIGWKDGVTVHWPGSVERTLVSVAPGAEERAYLAPSRLIGLCHPPHRLWAELYRSTRIHKLPAIPCGESFLRAAER